MGEIKISPQLELKLQELIYTLWINNYFGFIEASEEYVNKIYSFFSRIDNSPKYKCKDTKYGEYFSKFIMNHNTTIYVVFDEMEGNFLINTIFNNHEIGYSEYCYG